MLIHEHDVVLVDDLVSSLCWDVSGRWFEVKRISLKRCIPMRARARSTLRGRDVRALSARTCKRILCNRWCTCWCRMMSLISSRPPKRTESVSACSHSGTQDCRLHKRDRKCDESTPISRIGVIYVPFIIPYHVGVLTNKWLCIYSPPLITFKAHSSHSVGADEHPLITVSRCSPTYALLLYIYIKWCVWCCYGAVCDHSSTPLSRC